jgi:hypothetical protein
MRRLQRRRGATFVEIMVAGALLALVLGVSWFFFGTARKQADQLFKYTSVLQAATSIGSRLQLDVSAAYVPPGDPMASDLFEISPDGRSLGFTRSPPAEQTGATVVRGSGRRWVQYSTEPGPNGSFHIVRTLGEQTTRWAGVVATEVKFSLERAGGRPFVVAELLLLDEDTASRPELSNRRPYALRVVRRLRDPANFEALEGHLNDFPVDVLGPLPVESAVTATVPVVEDPDSPPPTPDPTGIGLEFGL